MHIQGYSPPDAILNQPYYHEFWAVGGVEPYTWTKAAGQPPYGTVFTGGTEAAISGVPTWEGQSFMSIALEDSDSPPNVDTVDIIINVVVSTFVCGDANGSGVVDIDDITYIITHIFQSGPPPNPIESGDANCSGEVDIDDIVYLITYIFAAGPEPCADCP